MKSRVLRLFVLSFAMASLALAQMASSSTQASASCAAMPAPNPDQLARCGGTARNRWLLWQPHAAKQDLESRV